MMVWHLWLKKNTKAALSDTDAERMNSQLPAIVSLLWIFALILSFQLRVILHFYYLDL